jgi:hypothetical protein
MPPTNQTMATAHEITSLPFSIIHDLTGATGDPTGDEFNLWYKVPAALITAAITTDRLLGARGYLTVATPGPFVRTYIYTDPPVGIYGTPYLDAKSNTFGDGRVQVPLDDVAQDYYLHVYIEDFSPPPTYTITMEVYLSDENQAIPAGSLFINNDEPGFPAAALSTADGSILAFIEDIAAGETGDILPSGIMALSDADANDIKIYNADLTLRATVPLTGDLGSGNQVDTFYLRDPSLVLHSFDADGNIGATTWGPFPTGSLLVAVSRDETIAYITNGLPNGTGFGGIVHRWDLVNDVQLSDLAPAFTSVNPFNLQQSGLSPGGILVLADGTILVNYYRSNSADSRIRHYAPDGTLLHTYNFTAPSTWTGIDRIAHDPTDDGLTFWTWVKGGGANFGRGRFERVRVSDGVALISVNSPEAQFGYQQRPDGNVTTEAFSHPFSCPFLLLRAEVGEPPEPPEPPLPEGCPPSTMEPRAVQGLDGCPGTL